jgi:hypothetical protein
MTGSNQVSNVVSSVVTPVALSGVKTPLLNQFEGAAAAYSLRRLKSWDDGSRVVRVRRESDNTERDFSSVEVSDGTMARWVNEQPTLPLDLRELDTNTGERDGALIEAAAAYSLRKLKEDFTGDVVEVRRNVDGETEGFTADEVTDGTLESFVSASFDEELPLDQATGAAAAYSLRNLSSSFTGDVVEVRRSSDDAVKSFTASEVADGTLEDWVNADLDITNRLIVPSDISTRFVVTSSTDASNYSASIDNDSASSDFAEIRSGLFGEGRYRLRGTLEVSDLIGVIKVRTNGGVPDGIQDVTLANGTNNLDFQFDITGDGSGTGAGSTLLYFFIPSGTSATLSVSNLTWEVTQADGRVRTWYDQSGSDNHAVQTTAANQPKIVEGGTLFTDADGNNTIKFDGVDDFLDCGARVVELSANAATVFALSDSAGQNGTRKGYIASEGDVLLPYSSNFILGDSDGTSALWVNATDFGAQSGGVELISFTWNQTNFQAYVDGAASGAAGTATVNTELTNTIIGASGNGTTYNSGRKITEFISYKSDQSDKRRAIEENIANHYDISLAAFSRDGTVSTWYDQSGSTNDATQTDPTKQPKIVDGGTLLKDSNNNPEVDFDGAGDTFVIDFGADLTQANSIFMVHQSDTTSSNLNELFDSVNQSAPRTLLDQSGSNYRMLAATNASTGVALTTDKSVIFALYNGASSFFAKNGVTSSTFDAGSVSINQNSNLGSSGSNSYDGTMQEFIIYNSDQSDNRTAIEANIGETYGITDIPAANDTVNGYVQTWYDQSGNVPANDAVQSAAANQPKIVGEVTSGQPHAFLGALVFDGSGSFMVASGFAFSPSGDMLISSVQKISTGQVYDARDGGADGIFVQQGGSDLRFRYNGDGSVDASGNNDLSLATFEIDGTTMTVYKNGSSAGTDTVVAGLSTTTDFHIGRNSFNVSNYANGKIYEIVAYDSDQSSNRPAVEANINNQYDIY